MTTSDAVLAIAAILAGISAVAFIITLIGKARTAKKAHPAKKTPKQRNRR